MRFAKILRADAALLPLLRAQKPQREQGKQEAKLLLTALPIKHDRLRCGEGKRQTLKCGPRAEVTLLGCRRVRTCWREAPVTLAHRAARVSMFIPLE